MGTMASAGHGEGIVVATGEKTQFGQVFLMMSEEESPQTLLQAEMKIVQDALRPRNGRKGIAYNMATSGGSGGNTTTTESARKVYSSQDLRSRLVDLCPAKYKYIYEEILFNSSNNLILRLTSSGEPLLVDKIGLNGDFGLKNVSEENLEKLHKLVRRLREKKERLSDVQSNLQDLLRRINLPSDPVVCLVEPLISCKRCNESGHTIRSCKLAKAEKNPEEISADDKAFWEYAQEDARPRTLANSYEEDEDDIPGDESESSSTDESENSSGDED